MLPGLFVAVCCGTAGTDWQSIVLYSVAIVLLGLIVLDFGDNDVCLFLHREGRRWLCRERPGYVALMLGSIAWLVAIGVAAQIGPATTVWCTLLGGLVPAGIFFRRQPGRLSGAPAGLLGLQVGCLATFSFAANGQPGWAMRLWFGLQAVALFVYLCATAIFTASVARQDAALGNWRPPRDLV